MREKSLFVLEKKEMVPRCSLGLALELRPCTPSTDYGTDKFWKYVEERELVEERRELIRSAGE